MIGSPPRAATRRRICSPGKITFLKFMLVWLLSARQVVLLCDSSVVFVFYHCQVYSRSLKSGFDDLPTRLGTSYSPVWALIDTDDNDRGPPFTSHSNIWPIQTSSPNSVRWKSRSKQNKAATLGDKELQHMSDFLHKITKYSTLAGWIFEARAIACSVVVGSRIDISRSLSAWSP